MVSGSVRSTAGGRCCDKSKGGRGLGWQSCKAQNSLVPVTTTLLCPAFLLDLAGKLHHTVGYLSGSVLSSCPTPRWLGSVSVLDTGFHGFSGFAVPR